MCHRELIRIVSIPGRHSDASHACGSWLDREPIAAKRIFFDFLEVVSDWPFGRPGADVRVGIVPLRNQIDLAGPHEFISCLAAFLQQASVQVRPAEVS